MGREGREASCEHDGLSLWRPWVCLLSEYPGGKGSLRRASAVYTRELRVLGKGERRSWKRRWRTLWLGVSDDGVKTKRPNADADAEKGRFRRLQPITVSSAFLGLPFDFSVEHTNGPLLVLSVARTIHKSSLRWPYALLHLRGCLRAPDYIAKLLNTMSQCR